MSNYNSLSPLPNQDFERLAKRSPYIRSMASSAKIAPQPAGQLLYFKNGELTSHPNLSIQEEWEYVINTGEAIPRLNWKGGINIIADDNWGPTPNGMFYMNYKGNYGGGRCGGINLECTYEFPEFNTHNAMRLLGPNLTAGQGICLQLGKQQSGNDMGFLGFQLVGVGHADNHLYFSGWGNGNNHKFYLNGRTYHASRTTIGTATDNGTDMLQVNGSVKATSVKVDTVVNLTAVTAPTSSADSSGATGDLKTDSAGNLYLKTATGWKKFTGVTF